MLAERSTILERFRLGHFATARLLSSMYDGAIVVGLPLSLPELCHLLFVPVIIACAYFGLRSLWYRFRVLPVQHCQAKLHGTPRLNNMFQVEQMQ